MILDAYILFSFVLNLLDFSLHNNIEIQVHETLACGLQFFEVLLFNALVLSITRLCNSQLPFIWTFILGNVKMYL